jgi:hypothetical protein
MEVSVEEMMSSSPSFRRGMKVLSMKSRKTSPRQELGEVLLAEDVDVEDLETFNDGPRDDDLPCPEVLAPEKELLTDAISVEDLPFDSFVTILSHRDGDIPEGAAIIGDPVLQYLESLSPGEVPKQVFAAMSSASLRVVYPFINGEGSVEAITDSGSQIVSMSGEEAAELGVAYDPSIQIHMQSAHGQVEKTLGLARNIPFRFGHVTVYLQVHILRRAPYKVLLGRPFEILTESVVRNSKDGSQTITMTDPNSGEKVTIPTRPRGFYKIAKPPRSTSTELPDESKPDF